MSDYDNAVAKNLTQIDRWGNSVPHHPMSIRLMNFISEHDSKDYADYFEWETGGDDETLMYQMDAFFELLDKDQSHDK